MPIAKVGPSLLWLSLALGPALVAQSTATVYRDPNGVPHIEATNERTAWYAVGYEQARDELLFMQVQHAWLQGRACERFGFEAGPIFGDLVVRVLDSRVTAADLADFGYQDAHIPGNFIVNVQAFCDGANAYRTVVAGATSGSSPEAALRLWLQTNNLSWVYTTPFDYLDALSWGRFNKAVLLTAVARGKSPIVDTVGFGLQQTAFAFDSIGQLPGPGGSSLPEYLERLNRGLPPLPTVGSNSFAWSSRFILDGGKNYSLCVADPHWGAQRFFLGLSSNPTQPFDYAKEVLNGTVSWFAHLKITPTGSSTAILDAFGDIPPGVPHFYLSHNRNIAFGGSQSGPNAADCMLLRLKMDANGDPVQPYQYYAHQLDTDGDDGADSSDWAPLTVATVNIPGPLGSGALSFNVWRAGRYGFVLPNFLAPSTLPVLYGEQWSPTNPWRLGFNDRRNRFYSSRQMVGGQVTTWPLVAALRVPADKDVGGGVAHHNRLGVALWEMSHARNVLDWGGQFVDHDGGYLTNGVAVDKYGTLIALQAATIPKRGDDAALQASPFGAGHPDNYKSYPHKAYAYTFATPMRCYSDRMFDWRYESPTSNLPVYLRPSTTIDANWQPWAYFDPRGVAYPPSIGGYAPDLWFENAGYMNFSNEVLWGMWGNGVKVKYSFTPPAVPDPTPFNNVVQVAPGSRLLQDILDQGLTYSQLVVAEEPLDRNQALSDALRERLRHFITGGTQGLPPLTKQQALDLVVTNQVYGDAYYTNSTLPPSNPPYGSYPTPVRLLKEVADQPGLANSPITRARKERKFFADLWVALNDPNWGSHTLPNSTVTTFRQAWVDNALSINGVARQVFWYDGATFRQETMPPGFALLDFVWDASDVGQGLTTADPLLLSAGDLQNPVALLAEWDQAVPERMFRMHADNSAALLLELYRQSFNAKGPVYGRKWRRLVDGVANGSDESVEWTGFGTHAFPYDQNSTYMVRPTLDAVLEPPYSAFYSDPQHTTRKAVLLPADITELVEFFLRLSGDYIDPAKNNNSMSLRNDRFLAGQDLLSKRPYTFPLTSGLATVATIRKLLETETFIGNMLGKQPSLFADKMVFGDVFRSRFYSYNNQQAYPLVGSPTQPAGDPFQPLDGVPTEGGMLRAIQYLPNPLHHAYEADRGLQPQFFGMGGSSLTLVTMFEAVDPLTQLPASPEVQSWFYCTPTVSPMDPTRSSYTNTFQPWAENQLIPTYYNNYRAVSGPPFSTHTY